MREMSTDRPDTTESAYTVDAGHIQLETSLVDFTRDNYHGGKLEDFALLATNLKVGLTNRTDLQFVFTPYQRQKSKQSGSKTVREGFSDDTQLRLKYNVWGNDQGETALAIMPFIKFPTGRHDLSNEHVEGGLIMPFALSLPYEWSLGVMGEVDFVFNDEDGNYGTDYLHTATIGHSIVGDLSGFLEYVGVIPVNTGSRYLPSFNAGVTYSLSKNTVVDCGTRVGLNESVEDYGLYFGLSLRH